MSVTVGTQVLVGNYVGKKRRIYNGQSGIVVKVRRGYGWVDVRFADGVVLKTLALD